MNPWCESGEGAERHWKKTPRNKRANRIGITKFPDLETQLAQFVKDRRNGGRAVTTVMIRRQARHFAKERGLVDFVGGPSWCHRFMKRAGLSIRTRTTVVQKTPDDWEEKMTSFNLFTDRHIKRLNLSDDKIINMDEVPMTFDAPTTRTATTQGDKTVTITTTGHEKTSFTAVLACTASGKKLKPMLIFKRMTLPKEKLPSGRCCHHVQQERVDEHRCHAALGRALLQVKTSSVDTILAVIPGGMRKKLQPLDISVNKVFKSHIREEWEAWMSEGIHSYTETGRKTSRRKRQPIVGQQTSTTSCWLCFIATARMMTLTAFQTSRQTSKTNRLFSEPPHHQ